jgi:hypothetical protein
MGCACFVASEPERGVATLSWAVPPGAVQHPQPAAAAVSTTASTLEWSAADSRQRSGGAARSSCAEVAAAAAQLPEVQRGMSAEALVYVAEAQSRADCAVSKARSVAAMGRTSDRRPTDESFRVQKCASSSCDYGRLSSSRQSWHATAPTVPSTNDEPVALRNVHLGMVGVREAVARSLSAAAVVVGA